MKLLKPSSILILLLMYVSTISCIAQTKKTSYLESDLYRFSQETLLTELKADKRAWMKKLKKGNKNAEQKLSQLTSKQNNLENILKDIPQDIAINDAPYLKKIGPNPPCPPKDCEGIEDLGSLIIGKDIKAITAVVLDAQGKKVGSLSSKTMSKDKLTGLKELPFKLKKNFKGRATIKVTRTPFKGKPYTYEYKTDIK